jgi:murein DD-endopeptidase MepM/ murein hydrolase activator NlpD
VNGQFVCVQSTLATSQGLIFIIGHLVPGSRVLNQNVTAGQRIGTVAAPDNLNGGISHIHIEVRPNAGSRSIPFTFANGTRICQQDFSSNGSAGQWAGVVVRGCR